MVDMDGIGVSSECESKTFYVVYPSGSGNASDVASLIVSRYSEDMKYLVASSAEDATVHVVIRFNSVRLLKRSFAPFDFEDASPAAVAASSFDKADEGVCVIYELLVRNKASVVLSGITYLELAWKLISDDASFIFRVVSAEDTRMFLATLLREKYDGAWMYDELIKHDFSTVDHTKHRNKGIAWVRVYVLFLLFIFSFRVYGIYLWGGSPVRVKG